MTTWETIKQQWNDNPVGVISAVGIAAASAATLISAVSSAQSRRAYAKQVNYRVKNSK